MTAPASIHDPITPEQAKTLPGWFWNVRKAQISAEQLARIEHTKALTKASNARAKERLMAARARGVA